MQSNGEPPNSVQEQQYNQASVCMCVCVYGCVCVWLVLQQNLPKCAVLIFMETTESVWCVETTANKKRYAVWVQFSSLNVLFFNLFFLSYFSEVHFTVEDCSSEGLWRLYAGTFSSRVFLLFYSTTYKSFFDGAVSHIRSYMFLFYRCVFVCCADLLTGPAVHLHVHSGSHLPILSQKTQAQR